MNGFPCKCSRILYLYYRLEQGYILNPKQIEKEFAISSRTLQRDIGELRCFYSNRGCTDGAYALVEYDRQEKGYILRSTA